MRARIRPCASLAPAWASLGNQGRDRDQEPPPRGKMASGEGRAAAVGEWTTDGGPWKEWRTTTTNPGTHQTPTGKSPRVGPRNAARQNPKQDVALLEKRPEHPPRRYLPALLPYYIRGLPVLSWPRRRQIATPLDGGLIRSDRAALTAREGHQQLSRSLSSVLSATSHPFPEARPAKGQAWAPAG